MLWELCSLDKVPPDDHALRRRQLRASGIDDDLAAIVDKALARDPAERYANAGELAADLKAFKAGVRISARRYSLFAMLAHWVRRHRGWSLAASGMLVLAAVGTALYVRNIRSERDLADTARIEAEHAKAAVLRAQRATDAALAEQTLKRAELLLESDPSAAEDVLATYNGDDRVALQILHARAQGLGLAAGRVTPHTDYIFWLQPLPNATVASLSADGTVSVTDLAGRSQVVARDVPNKDTFAYSEARGLLAYACRETDVCIVALTSTHPALTVRLAGYHPDGLVFSADGLQLAAVSHDGYAVRWDIADAAHPVLTQRWTASGRAINFLGPQTIAVVDSDRVTMTAGREAARRANVAGATSTDVSPKRRELVIGTATGIATVLDETASVRARRKLCDAALMAIRFMPDGDRIAFGCQNGAVGLWQPAASRIRMLAPVRGNAGLVACDRGGRYLAVGGSAHVLWIYDLMSGMTTSYMGHAVTVSALAMPAPGFDYFVSGDVNGVVRVWPTPPDRVQVVHAGPARVMDTIFLDDAQSILSTTTDASMHLQIGSKRLELTPHELGAQHLARSPDLDHVAAYGWGGKLEIWSTRECRRIALVDSGQTDTSQLAFLSAMEIVFAGNDGRVLRWTPAEGISTVAKLAGPIETFAVMPDRALIVAAPDGSLVRTGTDGTTHIVATQVDPLRVIDLSRDGRWLATGDSKGNVFVYDTQRWTRVAVAMVSGAIRRIRFSPDSRELAVASRGGLLEIAPLTDGTVRRWAAASALGARIPIYAREVAYAPRGHLVVTGGDGALWVRQPGGQWSFAATGTANITVLRTSADGGWLASADTAGRVMMMTLDTTTDHPLGRGAKEDDDIHW